MHRLIWISLTILAYRFRYIPFSFGLFVWGDNFNSQLFQLWSRQPNRYWVISCSFAFLVITWAKKYELFLRPLFKKKGAAGWLLLCLGFLLLSTIFQLYCYHQLSHYKLFMGRLLSSRLLTLSVWIGTLTYDQHDITLTHQKIGERVDSTTNIYNFILVFHLNLGGTGMNMVLGF